MLSIRALTWRSSELIPSWVQAKQYASSVESRDRRSHFRHRHRLNPGHLHPHIADIVLHYKVAVRLYFQDSPNVNGLDRYRHSVNRQGYD
jgi:hypothetical protein